LSRISTSKDFGNLPGDTDGSKATASKHRRALSEHKLLRSLPKLKIAGRKESRTEGQQADQMSSSQFLPSRPTPEELPQSSPDERPLQHKVKVTPGQDIHVEKRRTSERRSRHGSTAGLAKGRTPVSLAQRLQQIFEFEDMEEVISGTSRVFQNGASTDLSRISMLVATEHSTARLYVHHAEPHLFLCLPTQETRKSASPTYGTRD
jgi:sterol 3beta-glucosyltransferase